MTGQTDNRIAQRSRRGLWIFLGAIGLFLLAGTLVVLVPRPFFNAQSVRVVATERAPLGEPAGVEVYVGNRAGGKPIEGAEVCVESRSGVGGGWIADRQQTDKDGRCCFNVPTTGSGTLPFVPYHVRVRSKLGKDFIYGRVLLDRGLGGPPAEEPSGIYVVTDKPIYQPGQTIRYSAFVMVPETLAPRAGGETEISVFDSRGNVVDRKSAKASRHGNVSGELALAPEALTGQYRIAVACGELKAERRVEVKRYVRRRIKLAVAFEPGYVTAESGASALVSATYFSGSPASGAAFRVKISREGRSNDGGLAREFSATAGEDGTALVYIPALREALKDKEDWASLAAEVEVNDGGTPESWRGDLPVYRKGVRVELLPEGGSVLAGETNRFVLAAYRPDGRAAPGTYEVEFGGKRTAVSIGSRGCAEVALPAPAKGAAAVVSWKDAGGDEAQERIEFGALERNAVRLSVLPTSPRAGGELRVAAAVRRDILPELDELRVTLATARGIVSQRSLSGPGGSQPAASFKLPADVGQRAIVLAFVRTKKGESYRSRIEIPVLPASRPAMRIEPAKSELLPGEKTTLTLKLTGEGRKPLAGAATVIVTDAGILARAGGRTPEDRLTEWLAGLSAKLNLPPVVLAALADGKGLSFLPLRYGAPAVRSMNNAGRLDFDDRRRGIAWRNLVLAALISLVGGWLVYHIGRFVLSSVRIVELMVLVVIIGLLIGLMLPAVSRMRESARRGSGPPMSREEIERATQQGLARREQVPSGGDIPLAVRTRDYFPETLLFLPEVELDEKGEALVPVTLADNITTWHSSALGIADGGGLAGAGAEFLATKSFFVEPDFPVAFIEGDEPVLRVRVFNNGAEAKADVRLEPAPFFECAEPARSAALSRGGSRQLEFPLRFTKSGSFRLRIRAACGGNSDEVLLPVEVTPHGREATALSGGLLAAGETAAAGLPLPRESVLRSYTLRAHPSPLSEYLGGIEGLLKQPYGCFEQTTSVNYPNLMILGYLKSTGKLDPGLEAKARDFLKQGYQRLLGFEVRGGGFSLYGHAPASTWLSAYGLMQFHDMSRVVPVDPAVMERTWKFVSDRLDGVDVRTRSYAVWAALKAGHRDAPVTRHLAELARVARDSRSAYDQALALNACLEYEPASESGQELALRLAERLLKDSEAAGTYRTLSSAYGDGARVETLALAAIALSRAGVGGELQGQLLKRIAQLREPNGAWPGTQATVLALQAISGAGANGEGVEGELIVRGSGIVLGRLRLDGRSAAPQFLEFGPPPTDAVSVEFKGKGSVSYVLLARGQLRWGAEEADTGRKGLNLRMEAPDQPCPLGGEVPAKVVLQNRGDDAENCMLEIGLSPGLAPNEASLETLVAAGEIQKFEVQGSRLVLYLGGLPAGAQKQLGFKLLAVREGRFRAPLSRAYEYYRPENLAVVPGREVTVEAGSWKPQGQGVSPATGLQR